MAEDASIPDTEPADDATQKKLAQLEKQIGDYKLLVAELQTSARRLREDADKHRKYASEGFARDLLNAFDILDRATGEAKKAGDSGPLFQGISACVGLFLDTLKRHGINRMDTAAGSEFDPNLHMAVMQQPTNDFPPGSVVIVLQPGFTYHDRVLRPASVIVASEPPAGVA